VKIAVAANGTGLDAPTSPVFGRAPFYVLADTETMHVEAIENSERSSLRGAGFHSPELFVDRGAQAVVTGNVGPNAFRVLQALGVPVYLSAGGTVREAIEAYQAGRLQPAEGANVPTHSGRTRGKSVSADRWTDTWDAVPPALPASPASRDEEIAALSKTAEALRGRLALVLQRLYQLENEDER
jgi:predicted Fe-Mo cluster-binding NifX family protein